MLRYESEEFVMIPVPKSRVEEVFRLLSTPKENVLSPSSVSANGDSEWWTQEKISQLKREISNPTVIALLNLTSQGAAEWVGFDEVCRTTGKSPENARGDLGGLTRVIKRLFRENEKGWWPVEVRPTIPITYRMPAEIARRWREG